MGRRLWLAGVLALALGACDVTDPDEGPRVSVFLTDGPGNVDAVWLDVREIALIGDSTLVLPLQENGFITVTDLAHDFRELVNDAEIPDGNWSQIRLMVDGVVLRTEQGGIFATTGASMPSGVSGPAGELQCPSCFQTGIKLVLTGGDAQMEGGEDVGIVLDFDVAQSFAHPAGNSGKWVLRPVIHVMVVEDEDEADLAGNEIGGRVVLQNVTIPTCGGSARTVQDFVPTARATTLLSEGNPVLLSGDVEADGDFEIDGVAADTWTLGFLNTDLGSFEIVWTATVSPTSVTVSNADVSNVTYTVTGATCRAK